MMPEYWYLTKQSPTPFRGSWFQARSQAGAMGAIAPSVGSIAPSGASLGTQCRYVHTYLGTKLCCRYRSAQATDVLRLLDGISSVRLKLCCTAAPSLLIFSSLDGISSVRLKLCCTAAPRLLIFSSLDGISSVRLKLCCTAAPRLGESGVK